MSDDPVLQELEETGRKIWEKGGGTVEGVFDYCHKVAQQAIAEYALYGNRWRGVGREPAEPAGSALSRQPPRRRGGRKDAGNAVCVHEDSPGYGVGENSGSARDAGAEGDAE